MEIKRTPVRQHIILRAHSEPHLERTADQLNRLVREHGLRLQFGAAEVAYLETISRAVEHYTHKRQSGGTGQFARVKIRFEPLSAGMGYRFENAIVGGSVPVDSAPGVVRGLNSARAAGPIAGYPLTDFKATLIDGAYHEVDSSPLAFEIAARECLKEAAARAGPILLEPFMLLGVTTPDQYLRAVVANLAARRPVKLQHDEVGKSRHVHAIVPLSNMFGYESALRVITERQGEFRLEFDHYGRVSGAGPDLDDPHPGAAIGLRPA